MQIKTAMSYHLTPVRMAIIKFYLIFNYYKTIYFFKKAYSRVSHTKCYYSRGQQHAYWPLQVNSLGTALRTNEAPPCHLEMEWYP